MTAPKLTGCRCQCCACGEYFGSVAVFDRHRIGRHGVDRRCLSRSDMSALGWVQNDRGFWITCRLEAARVAVFRRPRGTPATTLQGVAP